ncbi:MAG: site-specific integrase [Vicinamibacterales bacterium]|nr:site-specific integrase [Vicinamibacterales bacterium]
MGTVYRRQVKFCRTCDRRLDTTAARRACESAGHTIEIREQPIWWVKYQVAGRPQCVSSGSDKKRVADDLLKEREGDVVKGMPITAQVGKIRFEEAADDLLNDYRTNKKRSLRTVTLRIEKHLKPFFGGRRMTGIGTALTRVFVTRRQAAGAANASINRDLIALKRMFTLALQGGKLMVRPYIPLLKENNVRRGFFEPEQFQSVRNHLPVHMRGIVEFANVTGWRTPSEILPLEWRQVDMKAGEVRLDAGTTKNGEARTFPFTTELRRVFEDQQKVAESLKREGEIARFVFCYTVGKKAGKQITESGFNKAWRKARIEAGCPGRIPHDFRRTAVRNLVRAGVPERVAMQLTGHKTRAVFERYNIVSSGDLRDAAQRLDVYAARAAS